MTILLAIACKTINPNKTLNIAKGRGAGARGPRGLFAQTEVGILPQSVGVLPQARGKKPFLVLNIFRMLHKGCHE